MTYTLMDKLKEGCQQRHQHVRSGSYADKIMSRQLSPEEYQVMLLANYWFHAYMERRISILLPNKWKQELEWQNRQKATYAIRDLKYLGVDAWAIPCPLIPEQLNDVWDALGALYVAEGTAIGGAIIKKNLLKNPLFGQNATITFYGCYGRELSRLWKSFEGFMHEMEAYATEKERALNAALSMFDLYERLLEHAEQELNSNKYANNRIGMRA